MVYILTEMTVEDEKVLEEVRVITRKVSRLETALYYILDRLERYLVSEERAGKDVRIAREKIKIWKSGLYEDKLLVKDILNERRELLGLSQFEDTTIFDQNDDLNFDCHLILSEFEAEAGFGEKFFVSVKEWSYIDPL